MVKMSRKLHHPLRAISSNFFKFLAQRRQGAKVFSFLAFASKEKAFAEHLKTQGKILV
jgi:hypothetical protein